MLLGELGEKLVLMEADRNIYVDFRLFGDRQTVAMDLYLREVLAIARMNPIGTGKKLFNLPQNRGNHRTVTSQPSRVAEVEPASRVEL
jgi:hypothetical protein